MSVRIRSLARDEFWEIANKAKSQGRDLAEMLDQVGVLVTPKRRAEIEALILESVADMLEAVPTQQLLPAGVPLTPADVQRYMAEAMRNIAKTARSL